MFAKQCIHFSLALLSCHVIYTLACHILCIAQEKKKHLESEIYLRGVCRRVDLVLLAFDIIQSTLSGMHIQRRAFSPYLLSLSKSDIFGHLAAGRLVPLTDRLTVYESF